MEYKRIGEKIRNLRQNKGLTQQDLADGVGVTWEMVSRYERGLSSPIQNLEKISKVLNTEPNELLSYLYPIKNKTTQYPESQIPYFSELPQNMDFSKINTRHQYSSPLWMKSYNKNVFAIDSKIINGKCAIDIENSILFISPLNKGEELVLFKNENSIGIESIKNVKNKSSILGVLIASEKRFV